MRDNMKPCQHTLSEDAIYKEVVIIGNGPSGMVTSFMLSGNVPYLKPVPEDLPIDEMLRARLSNIPASQSLYDTDLMELAEGLEGRSQNPIPLLMDNLLRPCADLGIQGDPLIEWKYDPDKQVEHAVLGRGPAGGAWPTYPPDVRTLSPAGWLTLPPLAAAGPPAARLPARAVAAYCRRYVRHARLQRYFRCGTVVTSVTGVQPASVRCDSSACPHNARFIVSGYDTSEGRPFRYACRRVVVACGGGDRPNTLQPRVVRHSLHSLADLERALHATSAREPGAVAVVGSGVSAADAVRAARAAGRRAAHVHRGPPAALAPLDPRLYPDYCEIYKMMCDGSSGNYENYKSYPEHIIVDVIPETTNTETLVKLNNDEIEDEAVRPKRIKLMNIVTNEVTEITVSIMAVFIGSKPDLFFLQTNFNLSAIKVNCTKCIKEESKTEETETKQCFLRNHWHYFKSVLGQSIQSCKSRYLNNTEINGNTNTKCVLPRCNRQDEEKKCACNIVTKFENGSIKTVQEDKVISYSETDVNCQCEPTNPYSSGIGFGVDTTKPVDCKHNPLAIDKSSHELLNAPKGLFALGPVTGDNFIRFIPGGALAIVSQIHREIKAE